MLWNHVLDLLAVLSSVNPDQPASALTVAILANLLMSPAVTLLETSQFPLSCILVAQFFKLLHFGRYIYLSLRNCTV